MIRRIIRGLAARRVTDCVLNLHHRPETLTAVLGDGRDLGVRVRYSWEQPRVLGSAGGPRQALSIVGADTFFIVNGDTIADVDVAALEAAHRASGALVTLALVPNREFDRYGGVWLHADGRLDRFTRRGAASNGSWHFVGVQIVHASVFADLTLGVPTNSIGGIYDDLIRTKPGSVRGFRTDTTFWDIGTPADYLRASGAFIADAVPAARTHIDPSAHLHDCVLWDDVSVGAGAQLTECIVTTGACVPAGAVYTRVILADRDGELIATLIDSDHG